MRYLSFFLKVIVTYVVFFIFLIIFHNWWLLGMTRMDTGCRRCLYSAKKKTTCFGSNCWTFIISFFCVCFRSRLADFHMNCRTTRHSITSCPNDNYHACLISYVGLIGEGSHTHINFISLPCTTWLTVLFICLMMWNVTNVFLVFKADGYKYKMLRSSVSD